MRIAEEHFQECGKFFYMPKCWLPRFFDDDGFALAA